MRCLVFTKDKGKEVFLLLNKKVVGKEGFLIHYLKYKIT